MKKVLFASTALVMAAGVASAEVTISGSANFGLKYEENRGDSAATTSVDESANEFFVTNEIDIDIKASAETDGGLALGASIDLDASSTDSTHKQDATDFDPEVFVSYNGLKVTVGNIGEAEVVGGIADLGFDGIGVDNVVEGIYDSGSNGSDDVRVDYAFGDISVALSADSDNTATATTDGFGLGIKGSVGDFNFGLGYADRKSGDEIVLTAGYSAGAFAVNAVYAERDAAVKVDGWGIDASYTTGDVTITAAYAESGATDAYGIGVAYDLGGATLAGGIGQNGAGNTVADMGISFGF